MESESHRFSFQSWRRIIITTVAVSFSLFQIYTGIFGAFDAYIQRTIHLTFGLILAFLLFPLKTKKTKINVLIDLTLIIISILIFYYIISHYDWIVTKRFMMVTPLTLIEKVLGVALIVVVLEAVRRIIGKMLLYVVLVFLIYPFLGPYLSGVLRSTRLTWQNLVDYQFLTTDGIFGVPLGMSANIIMVFIIFASFLVRCGGSTFLFNTAVALAGRSVGGPAKVGVIASAFIGSISGSGTANVVTTGSITIPMMKQMGYKSHFAGAVEAVASTGGQMLPPMMGATAFIMSAFTDIPYVQIMKYALFPALLFYIALYIMVDLEARKLNLPGIKTNESLFKNLKDYGHLLLPVIFLVWLLTKGYSPGYVASYALIALLIVSTIRKTTRMSFRSTIAALSDGAKNALVVVIATAAAGIIVGMIDITGLGFRVANSIIQFSGGYLLLTLIFAMFVSIILGMGMPTSPAYIIQTALVIPALIGLGLEVYVAHLFALYFACLSLITPPVAITSYAAAGIANANISKTGWTAFRLGLPAYIVPFMFVYGPSLLLVGSFMQIAITTSTALLGIFSFAVGLQGYLLRKTTLWERGLAIVAAFLLMVPRPYVSLIGLVILVLIIISQRFNVPQRIFDSKKA